MSLLTRYLLRRSLTMALVIAVSGSSLIFLLQLGRIGHHLLGPTGSASRVVRLFVLSWPTVTVAILPLAISLAILLELRRAAVCGELLAAKTCGASSAQMLGFALPVGLLGAAGLLLIAGTLAPASARRLAELARQCASSALLERLTPDRSHDLGSDVTILFRGTCPAAPASRCVERLWLEERRQRLLLFARRATLAPRVARNAIALELDGGELHLRTPEGDFQRARFHRATFEVDLGGALNRHLAFLDRLARPRRLPLSAGLHCLALALLAAIAGLTASVRPSRTALVALGLTAYHGAYLGLEAHGSSHTFGCASALLVLVAVAGQIIVDARGRRG